MSDEKAALAVIPDMSVGDEVQIGKGVYRFTRVLSFEEGRIELTAVRLVNE